MGFKILVLRYTGDLIELLSKIIFIDEIQRHLEELNKVVVMETLQSQFPGLAIGASTDNMLFVE